MSKNVALEKSSSTVQELGKYFLNEVFFMTVEILTKSHTKNSTNNYL